MSVAYGATNTISGNQLIAKTFATDSWGKSCLDTGNNIRQDACLSGYGLVCSTNANSYGLCMCSNDFTCTGMSSSSDFYTQCYSQTYYWDNQVYTCSKKYLNFIVFILKFTGSLIIL
jgi:hypothetical protein